MNQRERHLEELKALGYTQKDMAPLLTIEKKAHRFAELVCNEDISETAQDRHDTHITRSVKRLFGGTLPPGFFINGDPRGHALKIEQPNDKRLISYTDWGGYGILAPDFDQE